MPVSVSVRRLYLELLSLSVYRGVLDRPVTAALVRLLESAVGGEEQALCARWGELCRVLLQRGRLDSLPAAVAQEILEDENSFAIRLAAGALPDAADPDRMAEAARRDLDVLYRAATIQPETLCAALETGLSARLPDWGVAAAAARLSRGPWLRPVCRPSRLFVAGRRPPSRGAPRPDPPVGSQGLRRAAADRGG